jgi:hypothetical protein
MLRNEKKGEAEEREVEEDSNAFSNAEFLRSQVILSLSLSLPLSLSLSLPPSLSLSLSLSLTHTYTHTYTHTHIHTHTSFDFNIGARETSEYRAPMSSKSNQLYQISEIYIKYCPCIGGCRGAVSWAAVWNHPREHRIRQGENQVAFLFLKNQICIPVLTDAVCILMHSLLCMEANREGYMPRIQSVLFQIIALSAL